MQGIDECLLEAMRLPGARGAALVDWTSGLALGAVGEAPGGDQEAAAAEAAELARLAAEQRGPPRTRQSHGFQQALVDSLHRGSPPAWGSAE